MKLSTVSGRLDVSSTQVPGLGSGIFELSTGSHAEFEVACSLNFPATIIYFLFKLRTERRKNLFKITSKGAMNFIDIKTTNS